MRDDVDSLVERELKDDLISRSISESDLKPSNKGEQSPKNTPELEEQPVPEQV